MLLWTTRIGALSDVNPDAAVEAVETEFAGMLKDMIDAHMGT